MVIKMNYRKIAIFLASFVAFTFYGVEYWLGFYVSHTSLCYGIIGLLIVAMAALKNQKLSINRLNFVDALVVIVFLESLLWNNWDLAAGNTTKEFQFFWTIVLYVWMRNSENMDWMELFLKILKFVGIFYAVFTLMSYFSSDFYYAFIYPTISKSSPAVAARLVRLYSAGYMCGITAHYSTNGIYLGLGVIPFFIDCICSKSLYNSNRRKLNWIGFVIVLLSLFLTGKRAHLIFTLAALLIVVYMYNADKQFSRIFKIIGIIGLGALAIYFAAQFMPQVLNALNRIIETSKEGNFDMGRDELKAFAFLAFLQRPILGYGWSWFPNNNTISPGDYGHNVYYEILCETGVVGTAIIGLLFVVALIRGMRVLHILSVRKRKYPEFYRRVVCCAVAYEIFFLLYCSTGNPLYEYSCYLPYFLFIGMVEVINRKSKEISENE